MKSLTLVVLFLFSFFATAHCGWDLQDVTAYINLFLKKSGQAAVKNCKDLDDLALKILKNPLKQGEYIQNSTLPIRKSYYSIIKHPKDEFPHFPDVERKLLLGEFNGFGYATNGKKDICLLVKLVATADIDMRSLLERLNRRLGTNAKADADMSNIARKLEANPSLNITKEILDICPSGYRCSFGSFVGSGFDSLREAVNYFAAKNIDKRIKHIGAAFTPPDTVRIACLVKFKNE